MIGHKGDRINILLSLLDGEKVDFVQYEDDLETMLCNCLKPATIEHIEIIGNKARVRIPENQKASAIGK